MWVLDEIFQLGGYEYPVEVARLMEARPRPRRIVDIGACVGLASLFFLERFPDVFITALEPDTWNREVLLETVRANNLGDRWTVIPACASTRQGTVPFISDHFMSRIDPRGEAPGAETAPTIDVLPILDRADLVKIDIQGGEWEILSDPRFADLRIGAIVIEYHPYLAPSSEPYSDVRRLLSDAGFVIGRVANEHAGEGTIWAWKADQASPPTGW